MKQPAVPLFTWIADMHATGKPRREDLFTMKFSEAHRRKSVSRILYSRCTSSSCSSAQRSLKLLVSTAGEVRFEAPNEEDGADGGAADGDWGSSCRTASGTGCAGVGNVGACCSPSRGAGGAAVGESSQVTMSSWCNASMATRKRRVACLRFWPAAMAARCEDESV